MKIEGRKRARYYMGVGEGKVVEIMPAVCVSVDKAETIDPVKQFADKLYSKFAGHSNYHGDRILSAIQCMAEGKEVGSVEPIEPKQGKWEKVEKGGKRDPYWYIYRCTHCGSFYTDVKTNRYFYCPYCGAAMEVED